MIILFLLILVSQLLQCSSLGSQRRIALQRIKYELFFIATTANYACVCVLGRRACVGGVHGRCVRGRCVHRRCVCVCAVCVHLFNSLNADFLTTVGNNQ